MQLNKAAKVRVHIGESAPSNDTEAFHLLDYFKNDSFSYGGGEKLYCRAIGEACMVVVTT